MDRAKRAEGAALMRHQHVCVYSCTDVPDVTLLARDGVAFRFEFSRRFGPRMFGTRGRTVDTVPPRRSPFWAALDAWVAQGCRVNAQGLGLAHLPPVHRYVHLVGRQWVVVPEGADPAAVRRHWFEQANRVPPDDHVKVREVEP